MNRFMLGIGKSPYIVVIKELYPALDKQEQGGREGKVFNGEILPTCCQSLKCYLTGKVPLGAAKVTSLENIPFTYFFNEISCKKTSKRLQ